MATEIAETPVAHVDATEPEAKEDLKVDEVSFKDSKLESLKGEGEGHSGDKEETKQPLELNGGDKADLEADLVEKAVADQDGQEKHEGAHVGSDASGEGPSSSEGCESKSTSEAEKTPDSGAVESNSDASKVQGEPEESDSKTKDADSPKVHKQDGEADETGQKSEETDSEKAEDSGKSHSALSTDDSSTKCHSTCSSDLCEKKEEDLKANVDSSEVSPAS